MQKPANDCGPIPAAAWSPIGPGSATTAVEHADYLTLGSDQLYYVLHEPIGTKLAQVILAGPFASERPNIYSTWVRWARFLSERGFEVLRFDYRGANESTGAFEKLGFNSWLEDLAECARFLRPKAAGVPLILQGLGMGALLASHAFKDGLGDVMLLWSSPASGRQMLYEMLRLRLATDFVLGGMEKRRTREDYIAQLEAGGLVEVEGYLWSQKLWREADDFLLILPPWPAGASANPRPWKAMELDRASGQLLPLVAMLGRGKAMNPRSGPRSQPLNPDLSAFFGGTCEWLKEAVAHTRRCKS